METSGSKTSSIFSKYKSFFELALGRYRPARHAKSHCWKYLTSHRIIKIDEGPLSGGEVSHPDTEERVPFSLLVAALPIYILGNFGNGHGNG